MGNCPDEAIRIPREHGRSIFLQPDKEISIAKQAVFHYLGITAKQFAPRQRGQNLNVGNHETGLVKHPHEIFSAWRIDGRLAADRRINLRQKRGWNLYEIDTALEDSSGKSREIPDHAATQRDDQPAAFHILCKKRIDELVKLSEALPGGMTMGFGISPTPAKLFANSG